MDDWENDPAFKPTPRGKYANQWDSVINKAGIGGKISNPAPKGPWDTFVESISNTFSDAGSGLNALILRNNQAYRDEEVIRRNAQDHGQTAVQADALVHAQQAQQARDIQETRTQRDLAQQDDARRQPNQSRVAKVGRGVARMAGQVVGDINPTYAIPVLGESVAGRVVGQGAVGGINDMVSQGAEVHEGIIDKADPVQTLKAVAAGAAFQLPFEAPGQITKGIQTYKTKKLIEKGSAHQDFGDVVAITKHSESSDNPNAVSPKGATGLMQVMPETAKKPGYGIKPSNGTAADTQRVGIQLLARHVGHYDGDMEKAWAAYNWGQGNLDRAIKLHGDDWYKVAPRETQDYVAKNMVALKSHKANAETPAPEAVASDNAPKADDSVPPMDPQAIATIMGDPAAADVMASPEGLGDLHAGRLRLADDVHPDPFGGEIPPQKVEASSLFDRMANGAKAIMNDEAGAFRPFGKDVPNETDQGPREHGPFTEHRVEANGDMFLNYKTEAGGNLPIKMGIEPDGTAEISVDQFGSGKNKLGPREIRTAMHGLMDMYPEIKRFGGYRRSGAGAGRVQEITPQPRGLKELMADESGSFNPFGKKYDPTAPEAVHEPGHEPGGAIDRLSSVLQDLGKRRPEQEKMFSDQRTEQMKAASATGKHTDGVTGLYQEMSHMKGELKRPDIAPQGDKFEPHHLDELLKIVKENPRLNMYESINARKAIADLLTSDHPNLPTRGDIELLKKALPGKLVDQLTDKGLMQKFKEGTVSTLNVPRALMASMDVSAPFRQGIFLVGRKEFWKNIGPMLKMFVNPKYYRASMDAIEAHPNYRKMVKAGLALTDTSGDISHAEEAFIGANMAEKIPLVGLGVKASERAYVGFLNKLRADTFNNLYAKGKEIGKDWKANDGAGMRALAKYINNATGRGDMGKLTQAAPLLANVFFSPRLMASRVNLLNPGTYMQKDAFVRKEAIKDLIRFGSIATSVLGLAAFAGQDVSMDPKSSDFLKIRNGNARVGILGGFESYLRLGAGIATYMAKHAKGEDTAVKYGQATQADKIGQFFRYKESPMASIVHDYFAGKDAVGNKFNWTDAVANRMVPLVLQDIHDVYQDKGALAAAGAAPLAVAGFGVQDYQPRAPKEKKVKASSDWENDSAFGGPAKGGTAKANADWENDPVFKGMK